MIDYERCCKFLETKSSQNERSKLSFYLYDLFEKKSDLAKMIHDELEKGMFSPDSKAGAEFYILYRKYVTCSATVNKFIKKTQEDYHKLKA